MKPDRLKEAFGSTPEDVKRCVWRALQTERVEERPARRGVRLWAAAALAAVMLLGCVGLASSRLDGLADLFGYVDPDSGDVVVNEAAIRSIQAVNETYEGETVRFTLTEVMHNEADDQIALGWTLEPKAEGAEYYVLCYPTVGGANLSGGAAKYASEYLLSGPVSCYRNGWLKGDGLTVEMNFHIMKLNGELEPVSCEDDAKYEEYLAERVAAGKLPIGGDGLIEAPILPGGSYAESLIATGLVEEAEAFTVTFDLASVAAVSEKRVYEGDDVFVFDAFEVHVTECYATPSSSVVKLELVGNQPMTQEWLDRIGCVIECPDGEAEYWARAITGTIETMIREENGRWHASMEYQATLQAVYPETLTISLFEYDEAGEPTPLIGEGIELKLSEQK